MKTTILNFKIMNKYILIALISSLSLVASFSQSSSFIGLGDLAGGVFSSEALSVSADGSVVVGNSATVKGPQAFIWTESSGMVSLGNVADNSFKKSWANKVSADGKTVVGDGDPKGAGNYNDRQGFVWTAADGMKKFGSLDSSVSYRASAVSSDGSVIAGYGGKEAFYWTKSNGIKGLGVLPGTEESEIIGLSADGSVAIGSSQNADYSNQEAIRWTESEGMKGLGHIPGTTTSTCNAISPDGSVIGVTCFSISHFYACRWTNENGLEDLGSLPGKNITHPTGVSDKGSIIVGGGWKDGTNGQAYIWDSIHGMRDLKTVLQTEYGLNLTGWTLEVADAISPDGKIIVGTGTNPSGQKEAYRVVLGDPTGAKTITNNEAGFKIYPNPTSGRFTINLGKNLSQVEIYNLLGTQVFYKTFKNTTSAAIDLTGNAMGIYVFKVIADGNSFTEKLFLK
jgi:probable HAF family extracellular repeat protein